MLKGGGKSAIKADTSTNTTGQTLIISKKEFSAKYHVLLFAREQIDEAESKKISPEFPKEPKAEAFALDWMAKHPNGMPDSKD